MTIVQNDDVIDGKPERITSDLTCPSSPVLRACCHLPTTTQICHELIWQSQDPIVGIGEMLGCLLPPRPTKTGSADLHGAGEQWCYVYTGLPTCLLFQKGQDLCTDYTRLINLRLTIHAFSFLPSLLCTQTDLVLGPRCSWS